MDESKKTYYLELNGSKAYFNYDSNRQTFSRGGNNVTISKEKFEDFLCTARILGINAGEL